MLGINILPFPKGVPACQPVFPPIKTQNLAWLAVLCKQCQFLCKRCHFLETTCNIFKLATRATRFIVENNLLRSLPLLLLRTRDVAAQTFALLTHGEQNDNFKTNNSVSKHEKFRSCKTSTKSNLLKIVRKQSMENTRQIAPIEVDKSTTNTHLE